MCPKVGLQNCVQKSTIFYATRAGNMHFVDQGWCQVDLMKLRPLPAASGESESVNKSFLTTPPGPSLHAFTPRVRVLVQCARIHKRMKLTDLASILNVPVGFLRDIEEGASFPSNRVLEMLQDVLNVHLVPESVKTDVS